MPAWWKPSPKEGKISDKKIQEDKKSKKKESESDDRIISLSSGGGGSASNFCPDFDLGDKHVYPLPSPVSSALSSVSSSSSSDEPPSDLGFGIHRYSDQFNTPRGRSLKSVKQQQQPTIENRQLLSTSPVADHSDVFLHSNDGSSLIAKSGFSTFPRTGLHLRSTPHSLAPSPRARSPGPESRGRAFSTSPLHPRMARLSLDLMDAKLEGGKISGHPLPLPPGFPNSSPAHSPSSSAGPLSSRSSGGTENTVSLRSKWKKGKLLGRGTFGHVFVGFNSESGQMCAIKEVRVISDDQNSKESLRQLGQEITMLSHLSHPNIVQYYGSEMAEETLAVYLEYVSGGSIHKLLQEYGPFKEPVIRSYTAQILSGIAYLHGRNTVHRDIKGANILVDPNGEVKLADFGMAKHMTSCSSILSFKGSPFWMAPEVIMNSNGYGLAVDIWSLGCTVLEMATCKPPWSQYEGVAAIFKIGNSKDIPPIPDNISDDGKNFLMLCLQRDPSKRPTAAQLLEHPFVRDQTTGKIANISFNKDIMPSPSDNNPKQNTVDFHNSKGNHPLHDGDYDINHMVGFPFTSKISSEHASTRMNMSLPVSPCSSPLRQQFKNSNRSCWLSPPHPAYAMGTGSYDLSNYSAYAPRTSGGVLRKPKTNFLDSWPDMKAQTPDGSPRTRSMEGW